MKRIIRYGDEVKVVVMCNDEMAACVKDDSFTSIKQVCWCWEGERFTMNPNNKIEIRITNETREWSGTYTLKGKKID